jgi:hypothetical protein
MELGADVHEFVLPSGVKCGVTDLYGKHQRILTQGSNIGKRFNENLSTILADVMVYLGEIKNVTIEDVNEMLDCDRRAALCEVRQFSLDFNPNVAFNYEYTDEDTNRKIVFPVEIDLSKDDGRFPFVPVKVYNKDGELVPVVYSKYSDVIKNKNRIVTLPKSKKEITFIMLDGKGNEVGAAIKKKDRSSHSPIKMRRPIEYIPSSDGKNSTPVQVNLDTLKFKDVEHLRGEIRKLEGRVDTEVALKHPDTGEDIFLDILGVVAFFFPSGQI